MLDINLVPKNLRRKKKKSAFLGGLKLPKEVLFGLGGGFFALLVLFHLFLQISIFSKYFQHNKLKAESEKIAPEKQSADAVINKLRTIQAKIKTVEDISVGKNIAWSQKLNIISDVIPRGVWLKRVALTDEVLFLDGSAISQKANERFNIHTFATELKSDPLFLKDFHGLELGSIQSRKAQQTDIDDFLIKLKLQ